MVLVHILRQQKQREKKVDTGKALVLCLLFFAIFVLAVVKYGAALCGFAAVGHIFIGLGWIVEEMWQYPIFLHFLVVPVT